MQVRARWLLAAIILSLAMPQSEVWGAVKFDRKCDESGGDPPESRSEACRFTGRESWLVGQGGCRRVPSMRDCSLTEIKRLLPGVDPTTGIPGNLKVQCIPRPYEGRKPGVVVETNPYPGNTELCGDGPLRLYVSTDCGPKTAGNYLESEWSVSYEDNGNARPPTGKRLDPAKLRLTGPDGRQVTLSDSPRITVVNPDSVWPKKVTAQWPMPNERYNPCTEKMVLTAGDVKPVSVCPPGQFAVPDLVGVRISRAGAARSAAGTAVNIAQARLVMPDGSSAPRQSDLKVVAQSPAASVCATLVTLTVEPDCPDAAQKRMPDLMGLTPEEVGQRFGADWPAVRSYVLGGAGPEPNRMGHLPRVRGQHPAGGRPLDRVCAVSLVWGYQAPRLDLVGRSVEEARRTADALLPRVQLCRPGSAASGYCDTALGRGTVIMTSPPAGGWTDHPHWVDVAVKEPLLTPEAGMGTAGAAAAVWWWLRRRRAPAPAPASAAGSLPPDPPAVRGPTGAVRLRGRPDED